MEGHALATTSRHNWELLQNYLNNDFQAKVGKDHLNNLEPTPVGKQGVRNVALRFAARALEPRNHLTEFEARNHLT